MSKSENENNKSEYGLYKSVKDHVGDGVYSVIYMVFFYNIVIVTINHLVYNII